MLGVNTALARGSESDARCGCQELKSRTWRPARLSKHSPINEQLHALGASVKPAPPERGGPTVKRSLPCNALTLADGSSDNLLGERPKGHQIAALFRCICGGEQTGPVAGLLSGGECITAPVEVRGHQPTTP